MNAPQKPESRLPELCSNLRALPLAERRARIAEALSLEESVVHERLERGISGETANQMVENAIGVMGVPVGLGLNFVINGKPYVVPMATEEPSVIAAASNAAKRARDGGGYTATADDSLMIAQIEITGVRDYHAAHARITAERADLLRDADTKLTGLIEFGGGARDMEVRDLGDGRMVVHMIVDCRDAMGANLLNTMAEALAPRLAALAEGKFGLRILSNLCDRRKVRSTCRVPFESLAATRELGQQIAEGIESASRFAEADPYRATTHNKGIMNGVDAVVLATGNDWRAVEAGAHAFASIEGRYRPLSIWRADREDGTLRGSIEMPMALGIVGGALRMHPGAKMAVALLGVKTSAELAMVTVSVGLASNMAALWALSTEGIQRGHMALHHRTPAPAK